MSYQIPVLFPDSELLPSLKEDAKKHVGTSPKMRSAHLSSLRVQVLLIMHVCMCMGGEQVERKEGCG